MKHESNRPLSSRPTPAIFVRPQGAMSRGLRGKDSWWKRLIQETMDNFVSSQPHSSIGGNEVGLFLPSGNTSSSRAKCKVRVSFHFFSFFWRHLIAFKNDTTVISTYIMHISTARKKRNYWNEVGSSLPPGNTSSGRVRLSSLDFRVIVSLFSRHLFGIKKRQNSTHLKVLDRKTFFILQWT